MGFVHYIGKAYFDNRLVSPRFLLNLRLGREVNTEDRFVKNQMGE